MPKNWTSYVRTYMYVDGPNSDLAFAADKDQKMPIFSFMLPKHPEGVKIWNWNINPKMFLIKIFQN